MDSLYLYAESLLIQYQAPSLDWFARLPINTVLQDHNLKRKWSQDAEISQ